MVLSFKGSVDDSADACNSTQMTAVSLLPQRGCVPKPGVARNELPWVSVRK
jgi:hypothetical protein